MSFRDWITEGTVLKSQDEAIWIKRANTFDAFQWLGRCAKVDEGTENLGDLTVTQRLNPRGGLERDSVLSGAPGEATTTLTLKRLQADKKKSDLRNCFWNLDQRTQCGGMDSDAWNKWDEIIRHCYGKATERGIPGTAYDGDNEEQVVTFPWKSLWVDDLYRVTGEAATVTAKAAAITAMSTCQPARCGDICDDQEDCVVVAVTEGDGAANPWLIVNRHGGDLDEWETPVALAAWGVAEHATDVACVGEFLVVTSNVASAIIYSDDLGATQVEVATPTLPNCVDMTNQGFVVVGCDSGLIYASYDAARTWELIEDGDVTTDDVDHIMIARDNPRVIYAASAEGNAIIKSENGGRTWYACAVAGATTTALYVVNQTHVLVGTAAGEVYESSDGGVTWTEQTELPGLHTKANTTIVGICGCGCDSLGLATSDPTNNRDLVFRNVDGGADGRWFEPAEYEAIPASTDSLADVVCCSSSHFIAAGGQSATHDIVALFR